MPSSRSGGIEPPDHSHARACCGQQLALEGLRQELDEMASRITQVISRPGTHLQYLQYERDPL
jgi:hypothetical protein